ncbi:MAG: hypothetical protein HC831_25025 [Chloroflexia bacterium]|nr:hypothetical protein [Chloroflexia bacterium]
MKSVFLTFLILFFSISTSLYHAIGQEDSLKTRPKIGLVLSGGGAKGLMHIGVLKLIEKYNIPIDYITGTSMGSIVGALYSIGHSADEIEKIAKNLDWEEVLMAVQNGDLFQLKKKTKKESMSLKCL